MKQYTYDAIWRELSLHIGAGRLAPDGTMALTLEHQGEIDICWPDRAADKRAIWCHQQSLCDWLAVDTFCDYPADLYPLLTALSLEKVSTFLNSASFSPGGLTTGSLPAGWQITLTLRDGESRLPLVLVGWSAQQICRLTTGWHPFTSSTGSLPLTLPLSLGYGQLTLPQLLALQAGDGIVLHTADIAAGERWLWLGGKRLTMIEDENATLRVAEVTDVAATTSQGEALSGIMAAPLTLVAEVGQVTLTVAELTSLVPGAVLEGRASLTGGIRLTMNGSCIGYGSLLLLRDKWVVRIDTLINNQIALPDTTDAKEMAEQDKDKVLYGMAD